MGRPARVDALVRSMRSVMGSVPLTLKMRTGVYEDKPVAHKLITRLKDLGLSLITVRCQLHDLDLRSTILVSWLFLFSRRFS